MRFKFKRGVDALVTGFYSQETYGCLVDGAPSATMNDILVARFVEGLPGSWTSGLVTLPIPRRRVEGMLVTDPYQFIKGGATEPGPAESLPAFLCAIRLRARWDELTIVFAQEDAVGIPDEIAVRIPEVDWNANAEEWPP